ncbi:MAG TPA: FkbM family methyltransferase [Bryobacteraceae bacterium]|jgi:FkbM family methyltransferase|nr:FkbM family methyltransferase [Bryobacteraceae bacterium]
MLMKERIRDLLPRQLKQHTIHGGPLTGCAIYTSWHDYPGAILGTTEKALLQWFRRNVRSGETWLDVGAHYGYTAIALSRQVGASGRVFAFEPVLQTASCVIRTRELNGLRQLTVIPMGLADHPGIRTLELPTVRGMADSTIEARGSGECILTASLDSFWPSLCGDYPEIHGIKIDVQAMELDVLLGMKELLRRWAPKLIIEFHRGVNRDPLLHLLAACGYSTDWESLDPARPERVLADDISYAFRPLSNVCASLSTPSSTGQN